MGIFVKSKVSKVLPKFKIPGDYKVLETIRISTKVYLSFCFNVTSGQYGMAFAMVTDGKPKVTLYRIDSNLDDLQCQYAFTRFANGEYEVIADWENEKTDKKEKAETAFRIAAERKRAEGKRLMAKSGLDKLRGHFKLPKQTDFDLD